MGKTLRRTGRDCQGKTARDGKGGTKPNTYNEKPAVPEAVREERRDVAFRTQYYNCRAFRDVLRHQELMQRRHDALVEAYLEFKKQTNYQPAGCVLCNGPVNKWKTFRSSKFAMAIAGDTYVKPCICKRCIRTRGYGW